MNYKELITEYIEPYISSCVLMDSRARNDNGKYSDIDILRVIHPKFKEKKSEKIKNVLLNNVLAVINTYSVYEIAKSFTNPFLADCSRRNMD